MKRILIIGTFIFGWIFELLATPSSNSYFEKANKHYLNAKNDSALICLDLALANQQDTVSEYQQTIDILLLRSRVLSNLTFFEPALQDAIRAYNISKKHKISNTLATSLLGIGKVHYLMYNDSLAESYMLRAKEIAEKKALNKEMMMIENSLAQLYSALERNKECLAMAAKSLERSKQLKDTIYIIQNLSLYAAYYTNLNRYTDPVVSEYQVKVKQYLDEALQLASSQNYPLLTQKIYANYVRYYRVEKDYFQALNYANKVIEMCEPTHYTMLIQMYDHLVGIYANMGDVKMTINSHQRFYELMRKQSDYTLHRSLQEMKVKHDVQGKDLEIRNTQMHRWLLTITTISALLIGCLFYIMYRIRKKQNKHLHKLNATKDKLFSIISHDLKSPVTAQRLAVENMLENLDKYNTQHLQKNLSDFQQATETQLELLQNLLNWARVQTGEMKYRPVYLNISEMITEVAELYQLPANNKGITFNMNVDKDCIVMADRQMMHTILRNLVNNAVKFSHENGKILLQVKCTEKEVTVSVKDNGIGISEENMKALLTFDKSLSTLGTKGESGSGLGLITTKELLEKNGSKLIIKSVEGKGTEVMFSLQ